MTPTNAPMYVWWVGVTNEERRRKKRLKKKLRKNPWILMMNPAGTRAEELLEAVPNNKQTNST